jgi:hypothetical protein
MATATKTDIEKIVRLLTDQIIPRLGVEADGAEGEGEGDVVGADDGADDSAEAPTKDVPMAVTEAFEAAYRSLSGEQAEALASLFTAIGQEMGAGGVEGEDGESEEGEDDDVGTNPAEDVQTPPTRRRRFQRA